MTNVHQFYLKSWFLLRPFTQLLRALIQRHLLAVTRHFDCVGALNSFPAFKTMSRSLTRPSHLVDFNAIGWYYNLL